MFDTQLQELERLLPPSEGKGGQALLADATNLGIGLLADCQRRIKKLLVLPVHVTRRQPIGRQLLHPRMGRSRRPECWISGTTGPLRCGSGRSRPPRLMV